MTPKSNQADGYPIVSSMIAGGSWDALSALGDQAVVFAGMNDPSGNPITSFFGNETEGPMLIDPNWELSPNETLIFEGVALDNQPSADFPLDPVIPAQKLLSIAVHVWEFPGMDGNCDSPKEALRKRKVAQAAKKGG
jgi:hypothetical protein